MPGTAATVSRTTARCPYRPAKNRSATKRSAGNALQALCSTYADAATRLRTLADSGDHGVLLATHDLRAASQADRVLNLRDGEIVKETVLTSARPTRDILAELA